MTASVNLTKLARDPARYHVCFPFETAPQSMHISRSSPSNPLRHDVPTHGPDVPTLEYDVPTQGSDVPTQEEDVPTQKHDVPTKEHDVPTQEHDVPTTEPNVPTTEHDVPTTEPDVPTQEFHVPTTEPDVPTQGGGCTYRGDGNYTKACSYTMNLYVHSNVDCLVERLREIKLQVT